MKIKRTEFGTNVILIALFAITGSLSLLSAYGSACVAWNEARYTGVPYGMIFGYVAQNVLFFQISNVVAWLVAFLYIGTIWAVITQRSWGLLAGYITSIVGFVMGLVSALIADTNNFTEPFDMGSPHWAKTIANGIVIVTISIVLIARAINKIPFGTAIKTYTTEVPGARSVSTQLMMMSLFFFWFSFMSFMGTGFMANAHVISGINVWELVEIQTIGGVATAIAGCSMFAGGGLMKLFKSPTLFTRTL